MTPATAHVPDTEYDAVCAVGAPVRAARDSQPAVAVIAPSGEIRAESCEHGALVFGSHEDLRRAPPGAECLPRTLVLRPDANEARAVARLLLWQCRGGSITSARAWFRGADAAEPRW